MLHSHYTLISKPLIPLLPIVYLFPLPAHHCFLLLAVLLRLLLSLPPDSIRVLQWNAGGLRSRGTELLHFLSCHPVDLICMQESNLNSSSSFRIPGFSALRSNCTHSWSGILSRDATHTIGGVIIFVRHSLSFSELSTSSLSPRLIPTQHLSNSSSCHFLMCTLFLFDLLRRIPEPTPFLPPFFPPPKFFHS